MEPAYLSSLPGIGGRLKTRPEDFVVEEILSDGTICEIGKKLSRPDAEGDFVHFILEKRDWSTSSAIYEIADRMNCGQKRFSFAGTKDKTAISAQLVSAFQVEKPRLLGLNIKDMRINGAWQASDKVRLGSLLGNRFTITVADADGDSERKTAEIFSELGGKFPNYFGRQRFGSTRRNTHMVGLELLQGRAEEAALMFLCDTHGEEHSGAKEARSDLAETRDYSKAMKAFPRHLKLERKMLAYLEKNPGNYANAFRRLPRQTLLLFIHAFQSHIFNTMLSDRIAQGPLEIEEGEFFCGESMGFPDTGKPDGEGWPVGRIVGYETMLNEREEAMFEKLGIEKEIFRVKSMPELASKGTRRILLAPLKDFNHSGALFRFSLPSGSYATVAMREFQKVDA